MNIPNRPWYCYLISAAERISMSRFATEDEASAHGDLMIEAGICGGYEVEYRPTLTADEAEGLKLKKLMEDFI